MTIGPLDVPALQRAVGVNADGQAGIATWTAVFHKVGARLEMAEEMALAMARFAGPAGLLAGPRRLGHFLAQLLHESGSFRYMEEIASGAAYEWRKDLGNVVAGDGRRYKGRGPIQITGRANYRKFGRAIGIDLERHPEIAAVPSIGLQVALAYWSERDLNRSADSDDIKAVTRRINGGLNGIDDRIAQLRKVRGIIGG